MKTSHTTKMILPDSTVLLTPSKIEARRLPFDDRILLTASGTEEGICNIHWQLLPIPIFPATFAVIGERCEAIGAFPYKVQGIFTYPPEEDTLIVQTEEGPVTVIIQPSILPELGPEVDLTNPNLAIGCSYFSISMDEAISNAIEQFQKRFPGEDSLNAAVVSSWFSAGGSPVGLSAFCVLMERQV